MSKQQKALTEFEDYLMRFSVLMDFVPESETALKSVLGNLYSQLHEIFDQLDIDDETTLASNSGKLKSINS